MTQDELKARRAELEERRATRAKERAELQAKLAAADKDSMEAEAFQHDLLDLDKQEAEDNMLEQALAKDEWQEAAYTRREAAAARRKDMVNLAVTGFVAAVLVILAVGVTAQRGCSARNMAETAVGKLEETAGKIKALEQSQQEFVTKDQVEEILGKQIGILKDDNGRTITVGTAIRGMGSQLRTAVDNTGAAVEACNRMKQDASTYQNKADEALKLADSLAKLSAAMATASSVATDSIKENIAAAKDAAKEAKTAAAETATAKQTAEEAWKQANLSHKKEYDEYTKKLDEWAKTVRNATSPSTTAPPATGTHDYYQYQRGRYPARTY